MKDGITVSIGCNDMPVDSAIFPWGNKRDTIDDKYVHGELNLNFLGSNMPFLVVLIFYLTQDCHNMSYTPPPFKPSPLQCAMQSSTP